MRAVVCTGYGPPEVLHLTQVAKPTPGDHEVLVPVIATTVHAGDVRIRAFDVPRGQRVMAHLVLGVRGKLDRAAARTRLTPTGVHDPAGNLDPDNGG
jgi:D-arabinose 1-dehydrogenase-like Zn-dependent alcohol dehydrogenase